MTTQWNWRECRERRAFLALEDGAIFRGWSFGASRDVAGELVFNTGMTGYQEILSDPSYNGQLVVMTCPEIGNTGVNSPDMESPRLFANGFIVRQINPSSSWRSESRLDAFLRERGVPAIAGVDTRALTLCIRERGSLKAFLCASGALDPGAAVERARKWEGLENQDYVRRVTCEAPYHWDPDGSRTCSWDVAEKLPPEDLRVVAYDFGIKFNILRSMRRLGIGVRVVPAHTSAREAMAQKPDGVLLSNGPADPAAVGYAIEAARELIGKVPLMGICLGHQILGIAAGARTYKLKFGHHGCNHPVRNMADGRIEITSQNHNFAIASGSIDRSRLEITHVNLNDRTIEGIRHMREPMFAVQYHPEAAPGPHDPFYLFKKFRELMEKA